MDFTQEQFDVKFAIFLAGVERIATAHTTTQFKNLKPDTFTVNDGKKFIKVVRHHVDHNGHTSGGSVHCFVEKSTGDVLKPASWARPAKHARGNIFDADNGLGRMGPYGPAYLR